MLLAAGRGFEYPTPVAAGFGYPTPVVDGFEYPTPVVAGFEYPAPAPAAALAGAPPLPPARIFAAELKLLLLLALLLLALPLLLLPPVMPLAMPPSSLSLSLSLSRPKAARCFSAEIGSFPFPATSSFRGPVCFLPAALGRSAFDFSPPLLSTDGSLDPFAPAFRAEPPTERFDPASAANALPAPPAETPPPLPELPFSSLPPAAPPPAAAPNPFLYDDDVDDCWWESVVSEAPFAFLAPPNASEGVGLLWAA